MVFGDCNKNSYICVLVKGFLKHPDYELISKFTHLQPGS